MKWKKGKWWETSNMTNSRSAVSSISNENVNIRKQKKKKKREHMHQTIKAVEASRIITWKQIKRISTHLRLQ
jgi:hypothetical protein